MAAKKGKEKADTRQSLATTAGSTFATVISSPLFYLAAGIGAIKLVSSTGEQGASTLVFAALPVTALTLLSKSDIGKNVADALQEKMPQLDAEADELKARHQEARDRSSFFGPNRPCLTSPPPHLNGSVPGDSGFDPLNLSSDPQAFARYIECELLHARWAMLGAIGALVPESLEKFGGVDVGESIWWNVGAAKLSEDLTLNWGGIEGLRIAGKQGIGIIVACQIALMGGPEYARYVGIRSLEPVGVHLPGEALYPGGAPFDPLGFAQAPDSYVEQQVKEIKNGRLAMFAFAGYFVQGAVTKDGPVQNAIDFIKDPVNNNILKYL